jgi:hypothetical protein
MSRLFRSSCAAALFVSAIVSTSWADEPFGEARRYYEAGRLAYERGEFETSATAFAESYRLAPRPQALFSLAQALRQQYLLVDRRPAILERAAGLFKQYVVEVPTGPRHEQALKHLATLEAELARAKALQPQSEVPAAATAEARTQLMITSRTPRAAAAIDDDEPQETPLIQDVSPGEHRVRVSSPGFFTHELTVVAVEERLVVQEVSLDEQPAVVTISAPHGSAINVDGRPVGVSPLAGALELDAGRHRVVVGDLGRYPVARELELGRGERAEIAVILEPTQQRQIAFVALGTCGALILGGVVSAIAAASADHDASALNERRLDRLGLSHAEIDRYQELVSRRDTLAPLSYGLLGGAVTAATIGLLLYVFDAPRLDAIDAAAL